MFGHDAKTLKGFILIDGRVVAETKVCCHCGKHWVPEIGSGVLRGYCRSCDGDVCGALKCLDCYPFEKQLDDYEAMMNHGKKPSGKNLPLR